MKKTIPYFRAGLMVSLICFFLISTVFVTQASEFQGKIAKDYEDSAEWWPEPIKAPEGAPNILIFLLDDTGYSHLGAFGGRIETPNIDRLAQGGLIYNNFHTTALCSPSRAALLAGRNHHTVGMGSHSITAMGFPGYNALIPKEARSIAKILQQNGYVNYALGKWDHTPLDEVSIVGPFDRWPSGEGFQHFYGFMAAETDNFAPTMFSGHMPIEPWRGKKDYHLSEDLADKAIEFITAHKSVAPEKPFMMLWAPVATHAPHQAPRRYIEKYRGRFDTGWDKAREQILARQKSMGIVPENTRLSSRPEDIPAWDSLSAEERKLYARQMEVFAGMLDHADAQIGRIVAALKRIGALDDTLIMVTSDNGASGEGGLGGAYTENYVFNGKQAPIEVNRKYYEQWGGPTTYPHYHAGWAVAGNTPFKYFKQASHRGGIQDPLIIHWPKGIKARGEVRPQYHHIIDIAPTLLEATRIAMPETIDGVRQNPMDGISMRYSFDHGAAESRKQVQYYELFGNRGIWAAGWKAVTLHGDRMPWDFKSKNPFEDDIWELYHVAEDFSESIDVADKYPEKLTALKKRWEEEAWKYNVFPLYDNMAMRVRKQILRQFGDKATFTYNAPGAYRIAERVAAPIKIRPHSISTEIDLDGSEQGVIVAEGGMHAGFTLFIKDRKLHYDYAYLDDVHYRMSSDVLPLGKVRLEFRFIPSGFAKGMGQLYVSGEKADEVNMPAIHFGAFSLSETFDVGRDTGTPVSPLYEGAFPFTGKLDKVVVKLLRAGGKKGN